MSTDDALEEAIDVLQELGLREYEARCFVGLSRLPTGTAREISDVTDVPRTRVYEATRVLAAEGLVEVQHSSPQQFRAVSLTEAAEILREQYEHRVDRLTDALSGIEQLESTSDESVQEVWAMTGTESIANRTQRLIDAADDEVVVVIGDESLLTEELTASLRQTPNDVSVLIGAVSESLRDEIEPAVPEATVFVSGLDWLRQQRQAGEPSVGRLLLVDESTILLSTIVAESGEEHAIYGEGFGNGMVVIARRLMAQGRAEGLIASQD